MVASGSSRAIARYKTKLLQIFSVIKLKLLGNASTNFVMICEMEAMEDRLVVFDSLDCLKESKVVENNKLKALNDLIAQTEEAIRFKERHVEIMDEAINF
ncbi:hypothetical protein Tco_0819730 [Tanacetum coccineum]|uniref:Uncharacterized protein n=1 Tax=Tanacetum coccineum TaxID=301880 RepID=A0ABQ5ABR6_9ASTR